MASLLHSAEGSTWKKRNHKYLYKEGNRYIYPEDVQRRGGGGGIQRTKNKTARDILSEKGVRRVEYGEFDTGRKPASGLDKEEHGDRYRAVDTKKKNSRYGYEREYQTKYNTFEKPKFSKNKEKYDADWRYEDEIKAQRSRDYRAYDQARNRANAGSGRPDYKKLSEQHANREAARNGKVVNPTYTLRDDQGNKVARLQSKDKVQMPTVADYKKASQLTSGAKNRKKMVDNQGSVNYKKLSRDHADQAKEARELKRMEETQARNHRKDVLNKQGSRQYKYDSELYGVRDKTGRSGLRTQASQQDAKEMSRIHRNSTYQQALRDSNKAENDKLKNRIKNKGKKALDSIFRKRSKKK